MRPTAVMARARGGAVAVIAAALLSLAPIVGRAAALGAVDLDDATVLAAPPPRVAGSEADYTRVLVDDEASLSDRLLVHVEGPRGLPLTAFTAEPDRTLFSRLPESGRRGVWNALREEPLASSTLWLCFRLDNRSPCAAWVLVVEGAGALAGSADCAGDVADFEGDTGAVALHDSGRQVEFAGFQCGIGLAFHRFAPRQRGAQGVDATRRARRARHGAGEAPLP